MAEGSYDDAHPFLSYSIYLAKTKPLVELLATGEGEPYSSYIAVMPPDYAQASPRGVTSLPTRNSKRNIADMTLSHSRELPSRLAKKQT